MNTQSILNLQASAARPNSIEAMLARAQPFNDLRTDALNRLARRARTLRSRSRDYLFRANDSAHSLYVVVQGHIALLRQSTPGRERVLGLRGPGEMLGEDALISDAPHVMSARAVTNALCIGISREAAVREFENAPRLARGLLRCLSSGNCALERQIGSLGLQSGLERVASYLMRQIPLGMEDACDVELHCPKWMIASMLDLTKESFSRLLRQLADAELIVTRGRTIHVFKPARLATLCARGHSCVRCWGCPRGGAWVA